MYLLLSRVRGILSINMFSSSSAMKHYIASKFSSYKKEKNIGIKGEDKFLYLPANGFKKVDMNSKSGKGKIYIKADDVSSITSYGEDKSIIYLTSGKVLITEKLMASDFQQFVYAFTGRNVTFR